MNRKIHLNRMADQNLHHRIFHLAPKLLKLSGENGYDLLESFLLWADENNLMMDWTMHIHLLAWLYQEKKWMHVVKNDGEIAKELLTACAIHWSLSGLDHGSKNGLAKGILLASPYLKGVAIGLWKNEQPGLTHRLVAVHLDNDVALTIQEHCYALAYAHDNGSWKNVEWAKV